MNKISTVGVGTTDLWATYSSQGLGFTTITGFVSVSGTSETPFMLIRNPANSGVLVRFKDIFFYYRGVSHSKFYFPVLQNSDNNFGRNTFDNKQSIIGRDAFQSIAGLSSSYYICKWFVDSDVFYK